MNIIYEKLLAGEETDTTVTLETTPSSANITPSQSVDLNSVETSSTETFQLMSTGTLTYKID